MEAEDSSDPGEVDVRLARNVDAEILQRKQHKEDGSGSKGKRAKVSAVQKVGEKHVKARRQQTDAVIDLSDSPEQSERRVRKQARSSPAVLSPSKYKVWEEWSLFPAY